MTQIIVIGDDIYPASNQFISRLPVTFLLRNGASADGVLILFSAFFVEVSPVAFQIWRPLLHMPMSFKLVYSMVYTPQFSIIHNSVKVHGLYISYFYTSSIFQS